MEMPQDKSDVTRSVSIHNIKIIAGILILLLPLVYLMVNVHKPSKVAPVTSSPVTDNTQQALADIATLEAKMQAAPTVDNMVTLSMLYTNAKMPAKSIALLKKAVKLSPNNASVYNNLGVAYTMLQQYQNGIDACNRAIALDNNFQLAKNNLKWATDGKTKVLATIQAEEQVPDNKRNEAFYNDHAGNYFKVSEYDKAISIWQDGLKKTPNDLTYLNGIGTALVMKGEYDKALASFGKVLQLEPNNQLAKNNIVWANTEKADN